MYSISYTKTKTVRTGKHKNVRKKIRLKGTLNFRVIEKTGSIKTMCQISPVSIELNGTHYPELEKIYALPFIAAFNKKGNIKSFHFQQQVAQEDENDIASILSQAQFVIRKSITSAWNTTEKDLNGTYEAEYVYNKRLLEKKKISILKIFDEDGYPARDISAAVRESITEIAYGEPTTWLRRAKGREKISVFAGDESYATSTVNVSIKKIKFKPVKNLFIWKNSKNYKETIAEWSLKQKNTHSFTDSLKINEITKTYGSTSSRRVISTILGRSASPDNNSVNKITEYLVLFPDESVIVPLIIRGDAYNSSQRTAAITALGCAGHSRAQAALVRIMNDPAFNTDTRARSAEELGKTEKPENSTIDALWKAFSFRKSGNNGFIKISQCAAAAIGSLTGTLLLSERKDFLDTGEKTLDRIISELSSTQDIPGITSLLIAAGNTGSTDALDAIEDLIDSDRQQIRSAAAEALVHIEDSGAEKLLLKQLENEENPAVKKTILKALTAKKSREKTVFKVVDLVKSEKNDRVRGMMYQYLLKNRNYPDVITSLREMLTVETSASNRKIIREAIR